MNSVQKHNTSGQSTQVSMDPAGNCRSSSTLWVGSTESTPLICVSTHETAAELSLNLQIAEINQLELCVQVSQEILRIQGRWKAEAGVPEFFHPSDFESVIPLPHPVYPETLWVMQQPDGFLIQLAKQLQVPRFEVYLNDAANFSNRSQSFA